MKYAVFLLLVISTALLAHPLSENDQKIEHYRVGKISSMNQDNVYNYQFALLHNDLPRSTGRKYETYSNYDDAYIHHGGKKIREGILDNISFHSAEGPCSNKGISISSIGQIQINTMLQAPGHWISISALCKGALTKVENKLVALAKFPTLQAVNAKCSDGYSKILIRKDAYSVPSQCHL